MQETIYLQVKVLINYNKKSDRKEAIKKAKQCVLSTRIYASTGCDSKTVKVIKK